MKKILLGIVCLVMVASFALSPVKASAETTVASNTQQIQLLLQLIALLQAQLDALTGGKTTTTELNTAQVILDAVAVGTELEGHKLSNQEQYIFTDGKGGVDTVIYTNNKSDYLLYRGKDLPKKGYYNVIIVKGIKDSFIEIDVNSEYIQFADQKLSIPDFKVVKNTSTHQENLTISKVTLSLPNGIGHTRNLEVPIPDQKVTVEVKNNQYGATKLSEKKFKYKAYLYEISSSGSQTESQEVTGGEALVPYANGYSSFDFNIAGGLPYNGKSNERTFQVRVDIDTDDAVEESNEGDNSKWSDTWMMDYNKG